MGKASNQIIHENEMRRQHARMRIHGDAHIGHQVYPLRDISLGGVCLKGAIDNTLTDTQFSVKVNMMFDGFSIQVDLICRVEFVNITARETGLSFEALSASQVSLLNAIMRLGLAGKPITKDAIIHLTDDHDFHAFQRLPQNDNSASHSRTKRFVMMGAIMITGLVASFIIVMNMAVGLAGLL